MSKARTYWIRVTVEKLTRRAWVTVEVHGAIDAREAIVRATTAANEITGVGWDAIYARTTSKPTGLIVNKDDEEPTR